MGSASSIGVSASSDCSVESPSSTWNTTYLSVCCYRKEFLLTNEHIPLLNGQNLRLQLSLFKRIQHKITLLDIMLNVEYRPQE